MNVKERSQKMQRRAFLGLGAVGALGLMAEDNRADAEDVAGRKPNIVVILSDDIGYGDLGCYGATKVKTANLDHLAAGGVRFTDAHSPSSMCTPTRYSVITGEYAWRGPIRRGVLSGVAPLCIKPGRVTLPSLLKEGGYTTACVGKWHLGLGEGETDYNGDIKPGPLELGFDYFFGYPATNDRVPCVYVENHRVVGLDPNDPIRVSYGKPIGDEPTGRSSPESLKMQLSQGHADTIINGISRIGFMSGGKAARWKDEEMADTLTSKAVSFIERSKDKPFFLYFTPHEIHVPRVPSPRFRGTSQCGVRGDVIQELDWCVGEVLAALDRRKIAEQTLVIFTSDNGGVLDDGYADGAVRDLGGHACNGPLRGFKGGLYEGGHRVPFIARWPEKIKPRESGDLVCLVDLLATCAAIAGRGLPADAGPDSFNVLPALLGKAPQPCRDQLVMHAGGGGLAIRKGPWKLIPKAAAGAGKGRKKDKAAADVSSPAGELYNLAEDLGETKNVAAQHSEIVKELAALLQQSSDNGRSRP